MKRKLFLSLFMAGACCLSHAQQTGETLVADGHYYGAKQQFERFLDSAEPDDKAKSEAEALVLVCDYVMNRSNTSAAIQTWVENNPTSQYADVLTRLRRNLLIKEGKYDQAIDLFMKDKNKTQPAKLAYPLSNLSDEMDSYNSVLYRLVGEKLYDAQQYQQALPYLLDGEKTRTALYKIGMCHYKTALYSTNKEYAKDNFEKAYNSFAESAGANTDAMAQSAWLYAGIAALRGGGEDAAVAFRNAAQMNADTSLREQALYNYALSLHARSTTQAVLVMEQFLNEYPTSQYATAVSQCLTEVYMRKKDFSKALNTINKVQTPDADTQSDKQKVLYNLAYQELSNNRIQEALTYANQAVSLGNQDAEAYAEAYYIKGDCAYRLGNFQQASNDLNTAINLGAQTPKKALKNNTYAIYSLGYALFKQQKHNAAIPQFQKVTTLSDAGMSMKADSYNRIADSYLNMRNYDEAVANYEKAKATDHSMGDYSMLQQAYIEGLRGNYDNKVDIINRMNSEYAGSSLAAKALYEQGRAYVLSGKTDEAAAVFSSIAVKYPQSNYAQKAAEELSTMAANIAMQDSIAAAQDSIAIAEAKAPVMEAQAMLEAGQYQQAEQHINQAIDNGINKPYWLARAFILLSDIYRAEGRELEARQTLESLKANYKEDDDIKTMIDNRLAK